MKISNWDTWQSYRSDRGAPPWIKVHRNLMSNPEWAVLSDAEKGQLISIWIVAADKSGEVPDDSRILQKICQLDKQPNISKFKDLGFIDDDALQDDANLTSDGSQDDAPDKIRAEEKRVDKSRVEEIIVVFDFWKSTLCHTRAKLDDSRKKSISKAIELGYTVDDCKDAISGCSMTPFNMGGNPQGQKYDSLDLIFRTADKIDRFIANHSNPPTPQNDAERRVLGNIEAARRAMEEL